MTRRQRAAGRRALRKKLLAKTPAALEEVKLRTPAEEVRRRLRIHAPRGRGMSNELVDRLCRVCCSEEYRGTYSADCIPAGLATLGHFIIVANLGTRKNHLFGPLPAGHFVTIGATPSAVYYLDPYGMPCMQADVSRFLSHCCSLRTSRRKGSRNMRQVQHLTSVSCGLFATLFAKTLDRAWERRESPAVAFRRLKFHTRAEDLKKNDALCKYYLSLANHSL